MAEESRMKETVIDHDEESDVLYVNFHKPPKAADDSRTHGDFIFRLKDGEPIGVTILNFSRYKKVFKLLLKCEVQRSKQKKEVEGR